MRRVLVLLAALALVGVSAGCSDRASGTQRAAAPPAETVVGSSGL